MQKRKDSAQAYKTIPQIFARPTSEKQRRSTRVILRFLLFQGFQIN